MVFTYSLVAYQNFYVKTRNQYRRTNHINRCITHTIQIILLNENDSQQIILDNICSICHNRNMIEELEFIEQLQNVKKLVAVSSKNHPNMHVLKYLDILIDIHEKKFGEYQQNMEREFLNRREDA